MKELNEEIIRELINYCTRDMIPDPQFDSESQDRSEWFTEYFSFLGDKSLQQHLGEAFYQARFIYKLMKALHFKPGKHRGIVKFQIIQYASICEAVLDASKSRSSLWRIQESILHSMNINYIRM